MNYRINPFKTGNMWSFPTPIENYPNLPRRTLEENALVGGMADILEHIHGVMYSNFDIIMSDKPIRGKFFLGLELTWESGDRFDPTKGGNWYKGAAGMGGWLCPVLFDYFNPCPKKLYISIEGA
jgi:hypothetical protein